METETQELIDEAEEDYLDLTEEVNQENDLVGLPKMEFPEMNFDLDFE